MFGSSALHALDLVDHRSVTCLSSPSGRKVFQVVGASGNFYTCYISVHYCPCPAFAFSVLRRNESLLCKHILAIYLSQALQLSRQEPVSDQQMSHILSGKVRNSTKWLEIIFRKVFLKSRMRVEECEAVKDVDWQPAESKQAHNNGEGLGCSEFTLQKAMRVLTIDALELNLAQLLARHVENFSIDGQHDEQRQKHAAKEVEVDHEWNKADDERQDPKDGDNLSGSLARHKFVVSDQMKRAS
ncbi:zinc finger SWIM domain-containing protein 7-like [Scleropages formosus]|uniref:Zinc finger SWIM domain-containing protein 7-like n=1 Tax=Scleropages formosus TaxID=113540 RepID=A0A0P7TZ71_SCLFO|nr:zinc finger SWIM domain-containing protein 7-like [Scleropages formosus]